MTLPALYELAAEYRSAVDQLADLDLDAQTVSDTLESLGGDLQTKAVNVAKFALSLEAQAVAIKAAETGMAARRRAIEARAVRMREYLLTNMQHAGILKIECEYFKLAQRENPPSVMIDATDLLPAEFMTQPEPPPPAPNKTAIAAAIKAGRDVPGAHLVRGVRLDIK
jgi:hypothetical protein